eukprot:2978607-Pleurochrysis_carterae.AAC.1
MLQSATLTYPRHSLSGTEKAPQKCLTRTKARAAGEGGWDNENEPTERRAARLDSARRRARWRRLRRRARGMHAR